MVLGPDCSRMQAFLSVSEKASCLLMQGACFTHQAAKDKLPRMYASSLYTSPNVGHMGVSQFLFITMTIRSKERLGVRAFSRLPPIVNPLHASMPDIAFGMVCHIISYETTGSRHPD